MIDKSTKKMGRSIRKRAATTSKKMQNPPRLIQFGGYIFPASDILRIEDKIKPLYDAETEAEIGWTFGIILKNGDTLHWDFDEKEYEGQEALMNFYVQSESYIEALRIATMKAVWGVGATIVRPEDIVHHESIKLD
jgi:hypothetical protein